MTIKDIKDTFIEVEMLTIKADVFVLDTNVLTVVDTQVFEGYWKGKADRVPLDDGLNVKRVEINGLTHLTIILDGVYRCVNNPKLEVF